MAFFIMRLNSEVIEARNIPDAHLLIKGYLQGLQQDMLEQNDDIIKQREKEPEFEVRVVSKKIVYN